MLGLLALLLFTAFIHLLFSYQINALWHYSASCSCLLLPSTVTSACFFYSLMSHYPINNGGGGGTVTKCMNGSPILVLCILFDIIVQCKPYLGNKRRKLNKKWHMFSFLIFKCTYCVRMNIVLLFFLWLFFTVSQW